MSRIRVLKEAISNRIAAGEVIERPASVVKELVDNAIDSGADRIFINVQNGGSRMIQVTDNGSGMDEDDALMCLEAHATSKIHDVEDLEKITTFGFRGEAIPSIASVSRFEINTRVHDSIEGTKVVCEGGTIKNVETTGCPPGTNVTVRNLFFNVPARKKFLRSKATEETHIQETVLLLALSRLDIFIELRFDDRVVFSVPKAEDIRTRASLLFGREMLNEMLPVNYAEAGIMITGITARPGMTRKTRKEQRIFVNGRPVDSIAIYNGVKEAYSGMVIKGRHAPCLLYFVMSPTRMDINVHPAKREVRFKENRLLNSITAAAVGQSLRGLSGSSIRSAAPSFMESDSSNTSPAEETNPKDVQTPMPAPDVSRVNRPVFTIPHQPLVPEPPTEQTDKPDTFPTEEKNEQKASVTQPTSQELTAAKQTDFKEDDSFSKLDVLGQYGSKYILAKNETGLVLISIKAARERILFEKLQKEINNATPACQFLLLPVTIDLSPADTRLVNKYIDKIQKTGFEVEPFGGNTFVISAVPSAFPDENINGIFFDIIDQLRENPDGLRKHADNFLLQVICRSVFKLSRTKPLADEEIKHLISELSRAQMPYSCPAGKPVLIHFSENELLRRFGRKD